VRFENHAGHFEPDYKPMRSKKYKVEL
jgi:hypothetical protein